MKEQKTQGTDRREFIIKGARTIVALSVGGFGGFLAAGSQPCKTVWQIDPLMCLGCEKCATQCFKSISAVKCVNSYDICAYYESCPAYFQPGTVHLNEGAENQLCPTGAIQRRLIEQTYYEYMVDETLCIGCGRCVRACKRNCNGSFFLQVHHDLCLNCSECGIARACPANAIDRIPFEQAYILKRSLES